MIGALNHVGVAPPSIADSIKLYRDILGATKIGEPFDLPAEGGKVRVVDSPTAQSELIQPYDDTSPIVGILAPKPQGGQHDVGFEAADGPAAVAEMRAEVVNVLGTGGPRIGAHGTPVVLLHPKEMGGVLIELMESPKGDH